MSLLFQIISFMFPIVPCIINCVTNRISCDDTGHHLHDLFPAVEICLNNVFITIINYFGQFKKIV